MTTLSLVDRYRRLAGPIAIAVVIAAAGAFILHSRKSGNNTVNGPSQLADQLGIYVKADSPITAIREPKDIAGLRIVVGASTNQQQIMLRWDALNVAAGLKPVEPQYYDDALLSRLAALSGRADAEFEPDADGAYMARDGKTRRVGLFPSGWPQTAYISVTTRKGSGLAEAVTHALNTQITTGIYGKVIERWNLPKEAISKSETNPPGLAAQ
jgi:polar amino acid transport system substrate-binding protein